MIAPAMPSVPCTISGVMRVGQNAHEEHVHRRTTQRAGCLHIFQVAPLQHGGAHQARVARDRDNPNRQQRVDQPGAQHRHDGNRQEQAGKAISTSIERIITLSTQPPA